MTATTQIAQNLQAAIKDNVGFDAIIETIRTDRSIRTVEMREIASKFLGWEIKKGRTAALRLMVERQRIDARQAARAAQIDKHMQAW